MPSTCRRSGQKQIEVPMLQGCKKAVKIIRREEGGMGEYQGLVVGPELPSIGF